MTQTPMLGPVDAPDLHLMTFNIRRPMPHLSKRHPDSWSRRAPLVGRLLASERPTVLGVQEAMPRQLGVIESGLDAGYESVGRGRKASGSGERCPIFYDSSRLELVEWRQEALSATPDAPGSTSWGNRIPRILVVASFKDRATGTRFLVVNTHLDHISRTSRLLSANAILDIDSGELPIIVMGDFNSGVTSEVHDALTNSKQLQDAWYTADEQVTEPWGTFPNYRDPRRGAKRIDWILAGASVDVLRSAINVTRYDGAWPSDHAPVQMIARIQG